MFLLQIISKLYRELAESWTTMDCFCQITFQKSQPGQPQNIIENATFRLTRPKDKVFDGVWSKPISFGQTQPNENVIERIPLYFEWIEEVSGVSKVNVSTKRKCFQR